jgi:hypothetical protein
MPPNIKMYMSCVLVTSEEGCEGTGEGKEVTEEGE